MNSSGCGAVGRAVASAVRIQSSAFLFTFKSCIEKTKNKHKENRRLE